MITGQAIEPLVDVREVSVSFGAFKAVEHVSLSVAPGEIVGLIGPNGAGKSTLINTIAGISRPSSGEIRMRGANVSRLSADKRAKLGLTRTFQNLELFHSMTVYENIRTRVDAAAQRGRGLSPRSRARQAKAKRERAMSVLAQLDLVHLQGRTVSELSYAERKLVEFARAIVTDTDLVLLDEPTAGVALERRREVIRRIHEHMRERHVAAIVVEHDMNVISTLCEKVYVLDSGKLIASGAYGDVAQDERVRAAYLGTAHSHESEVAQNEQQTR